MLLTKKKLATIPSTKQGFRITSELIQSQIGKRSVRELKGKEAIFFTVCGQVCETLVLASLPFAIAHVEIHLNWVGYSLVPI